MNCATCERNLSAYIDDELTTEVRLEIEAHLDECERCRGELESHQAAWEAANMAQAGRAPDGLWDAIETELEQEVGTTNIEDLALMLRGLASEVQDLRRTVDGLRRDLAEGEWTEEREEDEDIRVQTRRFGTGRPRQASIEQLRRTS